ncbi:BNR repeat protein [Flavobacterium sp. 270]|uniref:sialidase family protein n=1 Tax=Flavobacterium sp. 270 TaxID=2512114 RepID=UPI001065E9D7|nr:sialidase family protein [Flavobacterium sp. 270]TDW48590.1 BNR repeat protein [Flavobacterium sp. 270]
MITTKFCPKIFLLLFNVLVFFSSCDDIFVTKKEYTETSRPPVSDSISVHDDYTSLESDYEARATFQYNEMSNPNDKIRGWQGCPSIGIKNNKIFVAWYGGEKGELPGNYIVLSISENMGQTWLPNKLLISPSENSLRMIDPSFWNDKFNDLNLTWTKTEGVWDFGAGGVWKVKIREVNNEIQITKPIRLFNGVMNVKPTILGTDNSTIIFPVSAWNLGVFDEKGNYIVSKDYNGAYIYNGYYNGKGELIGPSFFSKINLNNSIRSYDEHMIVALDENYLICMLRTTDGIYTTKSFDGGKSWETPIKYNDLGPTTSSRFFFGKLKSGNLLFVLNNSLTRNKLTAFLSTDNGKTWPYKLLLDSREVSYPDVAQNEEGEICVVYDRSRPYFGEILFLKFTEEDIITGNINNLTPRVISKLK